MTEQWRRPLSEVNFREGCFRTPCLRVPCFRVPCGQDDEPVPVIGNGLLNNLIAYWPGNEVNGNALDLHTNALHLTDTNTVTSNPGLVYPLARQYTAANLEAHTRPGSDALLSTGDIDFTLATFVNPDSLPTPGNAMDVASKDNGTGPGREYRLDISNTAGVYGWRWILFNAAGVVSLPTVTGATIGAWHMVLAWHDSVANQSGISINNGVPVLAPTAPPQSSSGAFIIGVHAGGVYFNGRIGPTMFWRRVLTVAQRQQLYNSGAGLTYAALTT